MFFKQLKILGLTSTDKLQWKEELKKDSVLTQLEPYLSVQRKSFIDLYVKEPKTSEIVYTEIEEATLQVQSDINVGLGWWRSKRTSTHQSLKVFLGIRTFILKNQGVLFSVEHVNKFDDRIFFYHDYHIFTFYEDLRQSRRYGLPKDYLEIKAIKAFDESLKKFMKNPPDKVNQADLIRLQKTIYRKVHNGSFSKEVLNKIPLPDDPCLSNLKSMRLSMPN
ncbi:MAG: hypothetical protein AAF693_16545 [Bacteroidota bacterium]